MNPETLAIARENLVSLGNSSPSPSEIDIEANRMHEANKSTPRIKPLVILAIAVAMSLPSKEQIDRAIQRVGEVLNTRVI